ncbi:hypothetical protein BGZ63DRAFT_418443 [Mariannaea sp. PMI_226]|nr:hypothetical protein BGZ63DRAFT_418443 [Mariannaea sp. PMI_226]
MTTLPSPPTVEILVHITAPSRVSDDVVYRQLAQSYLDFQPESCTQILLAEPLSTAGPRETEQKQTDVKRITAPTRELDLPMVAQSFELKSVDVSFRSVLDNRASPPFRYAADHDVIQSISQETNAVETQTSSSSWRAPPSEISDSHPMPDQTLLQVSPTRVLERYVGRMGSQWTSQDSSFPSCTPQKPRARSPQLNKADSSSSLLEPEAEEQESLEFQLPGYIKLSKTIPVTPQVPKAADVPPSSVDSIRLAVDESFLDITHVSSSAPSEHSNRAESEPPPSKRSKTAHLTHGDLVRSSSDTGPITLSSHPPSSNSIALELSSSLEIRSPSPPVGVVHLEPADFVTAKMAKLAMNLRSHYHPDAKREIDPFERGYWLLDCSAWTGEERLSAWVTLNNYMRDGHAGWGTWCRRDKSHGWLRLYCWGHVAKHMYLFLYIASKRRVKSTGAKWYDADGELVLNIAAS